MTWIGPGVAVGVGGGVGVAVGWRVGKTTVETNVTVGCASGNCVDSEQALRANAAHKRNSQ